MKTNNTIKEYFEQDNPTQIPSDFQEKLILNLTERIQKIEKRKKLLLFALISLCTVLSIIAIIALIQALTIFEISPSIQHNLQSMQNFQNSISGLNLSIPSPIILLITIIIAYFYLISQKEIKQLKQKLMRM